jgi:hypothetical protein
MLFGLFSRIWAEKKSGTFFSFQFWERSGGVKKLTEGPYKGVISIRWLFKNVKKLAILNISPPPFIPKLLGNLSSIASFFTFLKSHLILITPLYGPSVSFLTPPLLSQNWNEKKVPDFFSAQIRENNPNNILEVFQSTILDALVCGWNPRRMELQVGPGDWKTH